VLQQSRAPPRKKYECWLAGIDLAEKKDTNGAFLLVEATLAPGTEPPPHVHTREDELFYVLEGKFDVYAGQRLSM